MSVPYLTVCILCAFLGIAFLYRFCLVFRSSREGYETGACKTIGSREIQMDYFTIEENENGLLAVLADGMGKEAGGRIAAGNPRFPQLLRQSEYEEIYGAHCGSD